MMLKKGFKCKVTQHNTRGVYLRNANAINVKAHKIKNMSNQRYEGSELPWIAQMYLKCSYLGNMAYET